MSSRRNDIIANAATTLAGITEANGYHQDVASTSIDRFLALDPMEIGQQRCPWLGIGPDPRREPTPEWRPDKQSREHLFLAVQGVVLGQPGAERQQAVSELARDVVHIMMVDPTRGGNATSTLPISGPLADDGAPDQEQDGGRGTFVLVFDITFPVSWHAQSD